MICLSRTELEGPWTWGQKLVDCTAESGVHTLSPEMKMIILALVRGYQVEGQTFQGLAFWQLPTVSHTCRCLITVCQVSAGVDSVLRESFPDVKSCHCEAVMILFRSVSSWKLKKTNKKKNMHSVAEVFCN